MKSKQKNNLIHSIKAVTDIAKAVGGIANTSYLITLFKKMMGTTPAHYPQLQRK